MEEIRRWIRSELKFLRREQEKAYNEGRINYLYYLEGKEKALLEILDIWDNFKDLKDLERRLRRLQRRLQDYIDKMFFKGQYDAIDNILELIEREKLEEDIWEYLEIGVG